MTPKKQPVILLAYPSCFYYPSGMERMELKTSQLLLASYLNRSYPTIYADFEISIGRPNSPTQINRYKRKVKAYLANQQFDILALSCWTSLSYQATLTVARICRELYLDKLIVVGGYHPSARPDEFITPDNAIDYVICGEGETALMQLAENYSKSSRPSQTKIINSPSLPADDAFIYDWDLIKDFVNRHFPDGLLNLYIYLSRGCPFRCSFCMEPLKGNRWRAYPPDKSIAMINDTVKLFHSRGVAISDACFGMRPAWRKEFLRKLADESPDFWVIFETRPEYLDDEDISLLAKMNVEIQFGVESCSHRMLLLMNKTRQPQKFLNCFRIVSRKLSEHGVLHRANLIFNYPGETVSTLKETFDFIDEELQQRDSYLMWANHGYMHFPGCEVDTNRQMYEEKFGSKFLCPEWWKIDEDQYFNSLKVIPSSELDGENRDLWQHMLNNRRKAMKQTLAPEAVAFAARKYYPDWLDDSVKTQV